MFLNLNNLIIWFKAQCVGFICLPQKETDIIVEFRDCLCNLMLNKKLYPDNSSEYLEHLFILIRNMIASDNNEEILNKTILEKILSFQDLLLTEKNNDLVSNYKYLLSDYMKMIKKSEDKADIINYYFNCIHLNKGFPKIFLCLLEKLYINNLIIDLDPENQWNLIHYFLEGFSTKCEFNLENIDSKIYQILALSIIDLYYYLPSFENDPLSKCPFSSFLVNLILSSIVYSHNREKIIASEIKEDQVAFDCNNFTPDEIEVKLVLFSLCTKLIIKGIDKLKEIENKSKLINEINDAFEKIKCVLFKIADSNKNTIFFQRIFDYSNEPCTLFLEIYKLRIHTSNENNKVNETKTNCITSSNGLSNSSKEFTDEGGSLRGLVDLTLAVLSYHKNCFVFRVLNEMILDKEVSSKELKAILKQIMNSLICSSSNNSDNVSINECFYYGLIRVVLILYNISTNEERKSLFLEEDFCSNFQDFCNIVQKENLIYIRKIFYPENNRLICEMIFEILIEMYEFSENELFLVLLGDIFLVSENNSLKKINDYVNEVANGNKSVKNKINTLFYFLDCGKIKNHPKYPSRKRITEIEEALIGNQNDKTSNVNYTIFFLDKILIYLYHQEKKRTKLNISLTFINNVLYDDIYYLKKENSKSSPVYFNTNIKNWLYSQTRKIIEDKKNKTYEDVELQFKKIYEKNCLGCPLYSNYKVFTSSTFLHQNRAGSEASDSSGNNGSIFSASLNNGILDRNGSIVMIKGRTTSSPGGRIERSGTSSDFHVDDTDYVINIQESETPPKVKELAISLKDENWVTPKSLKKEEKTKNKNETQRVPSFSNNKIRIESFDEIHHNTLILCPKKQLLLTKFGIYFTDVFFESNLFKMMKQKYIFEFKPRAYSKLLNYPTKLKNFSNFEEPPLFLKLDSDFFTSEFFPISHPYFEKLVNPQKIKKIPFVQRKIKIQNVIKRYECELINVNGLFGQVTLTNEFIFFENIEKDPRKYNKDPKVQLQYVFSSIPADSVYKKKQFIIFYSEIEEILIRRFLYLWQALEIFCKDGKSYFINFLSKAKLDDFLQLISPFVGSEVVVNEKTSVKKMKKIQSEWVSNNIPTYEYLLKVNKYGTRSYKEPGQYPVFPWLLLRYDDLVNEKVKVFPTKDEVNGFGIKNNITYERSTVFRDMKYPINLQASEKREAAIQKYNENVQEGKFGSHLGTHYSTSSYVYYYLMRLIPYMNALILLQNKSQENPNRMFDSMLNTQIILDGGSDSRELTPEFFTNIEFMINLNCAFFGFKSNKKLVDDVISKNNTIQDYTRFLLLNKKLINHDKISKKITYWLDYVFGVYQITNKAESCNTYGKTSYAQKVDLEKKLKKAKDIYKDDADRIYQYMMEKISVIVNFGQSPYQIFKSIHPRIEILEEQNKDDFYMLGMELSTGSTTVTNNSKIVWFTNGESSDNILILTSKKELILLKKKKSELKNMHTFLCYFKFLPSITKEEKNSAVGNGIKQIKEKYGYYNSLEYSVIPMKNFTTFITCRYLDNSFKVHRFEDKITSIMTEDFVNAIAKIDETNFLIGLNNGKLMHWEISSNPSSSRCIERKYVICHESKIKVIEYNKRQNIIITAGSDNMVYIRKAYDFELLTAIRIESNYSIIECKLSNLNFLYVLVCNDETKEKKKAIIGYTINGLKFGKSKEYHLSNIQFTKSCNIISGVLGKNRAIFLWGYDLTTMGEIELEKQNKKKNEGKLTWIRLEKSIVYYSEQNGKLKQFDVQVEKVRPELFE